MPVSGQAFASIMVLPEPPRAGAVGGRMGGWANVQGQIRRGGGVATVQGLWCWAWLPKLGGLTWLCHTQLSGLAPVTSLFYSASVFHLSMGMIIPARPTAVGCCED